MSIQRYDLEPISNSVDLGETMMPISDGYFVKYEDHLAETEELKKEVLAHRIRPTKGDLELEIERYKRALETLYVRGWSLVDLNDGYAVQHRKRILTGAVSFRTALEAIENAMEEEKYYTSKLEELR